MDPFWKTILTTLLGAASLVGARYSADWVANHTYRANPAPAMVAEAPRPNYVRTQRYVRVPNYFRHSATPHRYYSPRSRRH